MIQNVQKSKPVYVTVTAIKETMAKKCIKGFFLKEKTMAEQCILDILKGKSLYMKSLAEY